MVRLTDRFSQHTLSLAIRGIDKHGQWEGERRGVRITLTKSPQTEIDGNRIHWKAFIKGGKRGSAKTGRAGTVALALAEIGEIIKRT